MRIEKINELGKIKVNDACLAQVAKHGITAVDGNAWLATKKGRMLDEAFFQEPDYSQAIEFKVVDDKIYCKIYVICKFGKSIRGISREIIAQVSRDLELVYDKEVAQVKVCIKGIFSKRLARRELEIIERYGFKK